jgi:hypothetical protein
LKLLNDNTTVVAMPKTSNGIKFDFSLSNLKFDTQYSGLLRERMDADIASGGNNLCLNDSIGYKMYDIVDHTPSYLEKYVPGVPFYDTNNIMSFNLFDGGVGTQYFPELSIGKMDILNNLFDISNQTKYILDENVFAFYDAGENRLEEIYFIQYIRKIQFIPIQQYEYYPQTRTAGHKFDNITCSITRNSTNLSVLNLFS